jgi:2',3'-cyclic-nucleotide 2'-phosphodiesterase
MIDGLECPDNAPLYLRVMDSTIDELPECGAEDGLLRILFLGDVVGEPGRKAVGDVLPKLKQELKVDFAIVNGENSAAGRGITPKLAIGLMRAGAAVITSGDHIWDQKEILPYLPTEPRMLRPANYPTDTPGYGWVVLETKKGKVGVINLQGRVFMNPPLDNPFKIAREIVAEIRKETSVIFVDFHAEATSEKVAMGWHLDGLVSAVAGTHTHVPTADEWILPGGTAFQADVGMCGPLVSVIGSQVEPVLEKFHTGMPVRFGVGRGTVRINGLLVTVEPSTGKAVAVERVKRFWEEPGTIPPAMKA